MEIQKLSASLSLFPDSSAFGLKTTCWLQHFSNNNKKRLENTRINIDASIYKGKRDSMFTIPNFELGLNSALLAGKGFIPVANPHLYTFTFEGKNNLDLLKLLLTEEAGKHIEAGDINFTGIVKGLKNRQVPFVDIRSNINQMQISVPKLEYNVSELNFKAHLNTGTHSDMTDAFLILDTLHAVFPENYLQFKGAVRNLKTPSFEMNGRADINLQNLSRLVNFNRIKDLGGDLYFELDFLGVTLNEKVWRATAYNHTSVSLNNVAFTLPGIGSVEQLNAEFSGNMDSIYLDTLHFISGNSDLSIRGEILHTKAIIAESEMESVADLHILSTHLDLPEFLQYYPSVKKGFNYQFKEVDLHTTLTIPYKEWHSFIKTPTLLFNFEYVKCTIDSFLPPIELYGGLFTLTEEAQNTILDFEGFDITLEEAELSGDFHLIVPDSTPQYMRANFSVNQFNPIQIFTYYNNTDNETADVSITGQIAGQLSLSDSLHPEGLINDVFFHGENLSFKIKEDTLICDELNITTDEISLSKIEDSNFLNRLKTTAQLTAKDISYKTLASDIFNAEIGMDRGVLGLSYSSPEYYDGNVSISIEPFKDIPSYAVNIEAQEFKYEQILQLLHQPSYVKGNGQFVTSLKAEGKNVSEILNSLNGKLTLGGDSLLMHGINVDEFIQKLNRSQNFNLADLGAFMVAGPIGLAVTKGSDYTRLILTSSKDSSLLVRVNSDWDITNGMLTSSDVAIATNKNRVALKGTYELLNDSLHLTVALLDANGCNAMSQTIEGSISKPELGELQVIKSILKPVTNLVGDVIDTNCDPFYTGSVKHPE